MIENVYRVLVVDDYEAIHDDVRKLLVPHESPADARLADLRAELFGGGVRRVAPRYRVDSALQGASGVDRVRAALGEGDPYAVAVVDVRMPPGMDGVETITHMRRLDADVQVILCTAYSDYVWSDLVNRLGQSDNLLILKKPFERIELEQMVSALSRKWALARVQREARERLERANEVYRASRAIFAVEDPARLPELIVAVAREAMGADDAEVLERGEPGQPELRGGGASIVYPLFAGDRHLGVLRLARSPGRTPFDAHDLERAAVLAAQVALALENTRLVRQVATSERLAGIGQLAAGVSHEINSPLAYVLSNQAFLRQRVGEMAQLDGREARGEVLRELYQVIDEMEEGAGRIQEIACDLRALARPDESKSAVVDLAEVVRFALRVSAAETRHRARVVSNLDGPFAVSGSSGRLSQVFINLLVNAAQAFGDRSEEGNEIVVSCERRGDQVIARVCDNGPGISPENQARIFDAFFTTKARTAGTGLGLAISSDIVRAHRGELRVESIPGRGTTFSVVLPAVA